MPGLLQTEDYMRALMQAGRTALSEPDPDDIEARVQFRLERQQLLRHANPPVRWFVIGGAALLRPKGNQEILRDQINHLLEIIDTHRQVVVQVAPLSIADIPMLGGPIGIFRFGERVPAIAHQVTLLGGGVYLNDEQEVANCSYLFDRLRAVALGPKESRSFIRRCIEE